MTDSRTRILNAASELFLEGGLAALSVRAIASRAGLSTIGIYSHFDGKQGILDSLYIEGFERVSSALKTPLDNLSPREQLLARTSAYMSVAEKYAAHYRLIFGELDSQYQPSAEARRAGEEAFSTLLTVVGKLLPENHDLKYKQQRALQIWALVHGYVSLKSHAISRMIEGIDWDKLVLDAMGELYDSLVLTPDPDR